MTAQEIATETGAHYQTIVRIVRAKVKADPSFVDEVVFREGKGKRAWDFSPEKTAIIKARLKELHPDPTPKGSNTVQRREWFETWVKILQKYQEIDEGAWTDVAAIICVMFCSKDLELLTGKYGAARVGDHALRLIRGLDPSCFLHDTDPFSVWLRESGFSADTFA